VRGLAHPLPRPIGDLNDQQAQIRIMSCPGLGWRAATCSCRREAVDRAKSQQPASISDDEPGRIPLDSSPMSQGLPASCPARPAGQPPTQPPLLRERILSVSKAVTPAPACSIKPAHRHSAGQALLPQRRQRLQPAYRPHKPQPPIAPKALHRCPSLLRPQSQLPQPVKPRYGAAAPSPARARRSA